MNMYVPLDEYVVEDGYAVQVYKNRYDEGKYKQVRGEYVMVKDYVLDVEQVKEKYPEMWL